MDSATPSNKNPNVYQIGGIPVEFPYKPYGSQLAFMGRVISALDRAQRQGHCHALLESPTGTGKSLSLLCSALAWQRHQRSKPQNANPSHPQPTPGPDPDPDLYVSGGGFIPEPDPSGNLQAGNSEQSVPATTKRTQKPQRMYTIYYASRTHSQISQVIREYRKTSYRVPMAVLASRKHYCTNANVCMKENVDEECKLLLNDYRPENITCLEFKNAHRVKDHHSLKERGCHEAHDIEDLVKIGRAMRGCSYFAARDLAKEAQLVFCPYSYIINPVIRRAMEVDLKDAIVILDEAHNIEDMAREAISLDVEEETLDILQKELGDLCLDERVEIYQPLYDMIQGIVCWMGQRKNNLKKHDFEHSLSCWTGDNALRELQEAGISQEHFPILQECATKAIEASSDSELEIAHLSSMAAATLEGLFTSFSYFFSENGSHSIDYQLALQRFVKRDSRYAASGLTHSLSLWCLNPALAFKEIANLSLSVILTSGTLSPMSSFSSELGVQFEACMEAPHVIDVESQLWAGVISTGPRNCQLNASYKTADGYAFQDSLGASLEEICKVVPGGALVFFPSYNLLEKLCTRWVQTGQWSRLNAQKCLFVEPRGTQDDFEHILKGYYDSIRGNNKNTSKGTTPWKLKRGNKRGINCSIAKESPRSPSNAAAFLAVCRGKASEGIDFSDENARAVIIVGIPFPNKTNIQVALKKKYNDTYKSSRNLLSGSTWYCQQAFRALNQAAGRCIRHRFDYGAIIFMDERFREERNVAYISKWLRKSIKQYDSFDLSLESLRAFFQNVKERFSEKGADVKDSCLENSVINMEKDDDKTLSQLQYQGNLEPEAAVQTDETDVSRLSEIVQTGSSNCGFDQTVVTKVPGTCDNNSSPRTISKDDMSHSTIAQSFSPFSDQQSFYSISETNSPGAVSGGACTSAVTPERKATADEHDSSLNLSVNSHSQKRRNPSQTAPSISHAESSHVHHIRNMNRSRDMIQETRMVFEADCSKCKHQKVEVQRVTSVESTNALSMHSELVMDHKLHILCSSCRNPLGLPENDFLVMCSLTSTSKSYLASLLKCEPESQDRIEVPSISVLISDASSVDQHLSKGCIIEGIPQRGIWCEEDGCVFRTIYCPFCTDNKTFLGVQIMAADSFNIQLLNKIILYVAHLVIKDHEQASKDKDLLTTNSSNPTGKVPDFTSIEKYSYTPHLRSSGGWSTTKSKLRLPK